MRLFRNSTLSAVVLLVLSVTGCGSKRSAPPAAAPVAAPSPAPAPAPAPAPGTTAPHVDQTTTEIGGSTKMPAGNIPDRARSGNVSSTSQISLPNKSELDSEVQTLAPNIGSIFSREKTLRALNGFQSLAVGPNCWNAALLSAGLVSTKRPVTKPEYWFWMNSKLCRTLTADEPLRPGDLGSIFWKSWGNYHSFMRIDDTKVFYKEGPDSADRYQFGNFEDMFFDDYKKMASECKGTEGALKRKKCEIQIVYHRCNPVPMDFYSRFPELVQIQEKLQPFENFMSEWIAKKPAELRPEMEKNIIGLGEVLKELKAMKFVGEKEFARKALEWRAVGLILTDYQRIKFNQPEADWAVQAAVDLDAQRTNIPETAAMVLRKKR